MRSRTPLILFLVIAALVALAGCATTPTATPVPAAAKPQVPAHPTASAAQSAPTQVVVASEDSRARITVGGTLFDAAALRDMQVTRNVTTPKGQQAEYTGIGVKALLNKVGLKAETLAFVASDGYSAEVALVDINQDCMLAYNDHDGFDAVMPGLDGGAWVHDIVEIATAAKAIEATRSDTSATPGEPVADAAITVNGVAFAKSDVDAMEQLTQDVDGTSYSGVRFLDVLDAAGITGGDIVMAATDGYEGMIAYDELTDSCMLAWELDESGDSSGTLAAVLPGIDKGKWVRMLGTIYVDGQAPAAPEASEPTEIPADAILVVGNREYTLADLQALPLVSADVEGTHHEGVSFLAVLAEAGLTSGSVIMTANDGYEAGVAIDTLIETDMLEYDEASNTMWSVLPEQSKGLWCKFIASITLDGGAPVSAEPMPTRAKSNSDETVIVVDSLGHEVAIPKGANAIASMRSGITEIICALGQADKIIAVDEMVKAGTSYGKFITQVHPELRRCVAPYRHMDINAEEMLRLDPDVVLHGGYGRIRQAEALQKQLPDMPIVIAHFETLETYTDDVRIVAQCVGAEDMAKNLVATLQGTLDFVTDRVEDLPEDERVRVFYGGHDIYHAYTSTTFEHAQIEVAGGVNVAGEMEGWLPEISPEQLLVWDPEVIIVLNGVDVDAILADEKVQYVSAIKNKRVYALPEASWDFSSPRALFAIEWLAYQLYPERFADINIKAEADAFYQAVFGVDYTGPALSDKPMMAAETRTVTDMIGRIVRVPANIERAVPLSSDITAILAVLETTDQLAAVDSMTTQNAHLQAAFPSLAELPGPCAFYNANAESLLAVDPDLIVTVSWQRDPDKLQEMMGVPVVCVDINLYEPAIRFLCELMGAGDRGEALIGYYQERMAMVHDALADIEPVRVYVGGGDGMLSTFGAESTWHYEILDAGGVNVAANTKGGGSHCVSLEQVMLWDPQVIILDNSCPDEPEDVLADAKWGGITAVQEGKVYKASPGYMGTWGRPHIESAMARVWLADKLYGDVLGFNLMDEAATFYELLFGETLSQAQIQEILGE